MESGIMALVVPAAIYVALNSIPGVIAGFIWQSRGGEFSDGFWMGLFLSLIGIFIAALVKPLRPWQPHDGPMLPPGAEKISV